MEYIMKICLLGNQAVGKTSLVYRFIENRFSTDFKSTLGVNLLKRTVTLDNNRKVSVQIWDLGGQEAYRKLRKIYLEGGQGALIVFDKTNRESFEALDDWITSFKEVQPDAPMILIGNKIDLVDSITVSDEEAEQYAEKYNMEYISTSAKTGEKVDDAFKSLIEKVLNSLEAEKSE